MSKKERLRGSACLGHSGMVASWWRTAADTDKRLYRQPEITIFESAASDENVYIPAASVKIYGAERLRALRSVIEEALRNEPDGESK